MPPTPTDASPTTRPAATARIDQIAAEIAHRLDADPQVTALVAPHLMEAGAVAMLDTVIAALDNEGRAFADGLAGKQRIGAHLMNGELVAKLKLLRRMTTEGT